MNQGQVRRLPLSGILVFMLLFSAGRSKLAQALQQSPPPPDASESKDNKRIAGTAVITKIEGSAKDAIYHADGYRVRVADGTMAEFFGALKTATDVDAGSWIRYEGQLDDSGTLVASKVSFLSAGARKGISWMGPRKAVEAPPYKEMSAEGLIDADGVVTEADPKINLSVADDPCRWNRLVFDTAVQERVERVGLSVVPTYQKELPFDSPARIPFRFYAISAPTRQELLACDHGLILIPIGLIPRLRNDDQLAAVLANAVAEALDSQYWGLTTKDLAGMGASAALAQFGLGGAMGSLTMSGYSAAEKNSRVWHQSARVSLQLLADAGYDPWQAPEASRLVSRRKLPRDLDSLHYTAAGKYQLSLLKQFYPPAHDSTPQAASR